MSGLPRLILIVARLGMVTLGACSVGGSDGGAGTISFALPNGWTVETISYVVSSSNEDLLVSGTENVSDPDATLSLTVNLAVGRGDVLELTATTTAGISCRGTSQPFDVVAGQSTFVNLVLLCGGVAVGPDSCPLVTLEAPNPAEATLPSGAITVSARASDPDPGDVLSFSWAASPGEGTFGDSTAQATRYVCASAGVETLVLKVDDHHLPAFCTMTFLLPVTCLAGGDVGS